MTSPTDMLLSKLREAVAAKVRFWDASRALELELGLEDVPDHIDHTIQEELSTLATALNTPEQAYSAITQEYLNDLLEKVK